MISSIYICSSGGNWIYFLPRTSLCKAADWKSPAETSRVRNSNLSIVFANLSIHQVISKPWKDLKSWVRSLCRPPTPWSAPLDLSGSSSVVCPQVAFEQLLYLQYFVDDNLVGLFIKILLGPVKADWCGIRRLSRRRRLPPAQHLLPPWGFPLRRLGPRSRLDLWGRLPHRQCQVFLDLISSHHERSGTTSTVLTGGWTRV